MLALNRLVAFHRHRMFPIVIGLLAVIFLGGGGYLTFVRPQQIVAAAKEDANRSIDDARKGLAYADSVLASMKWFKPAYRDGPRLKLAAVHDTLETDAKSAAELFSSAGKGTWRRRAALYREADKQADLALKLAGSVVSEMRYYLELRREAFTKAETFRERKGEAEEKVPQISARIESEVVRYPSRYSHEISKRRDSATAQLEALGPIPARFDKELPAEDDASESGDPDAALQVLNPALARAEVLRQEILDALNWLDITAERYEKAPAMVEQAAQQASLAEKGLADRRAGTGYWLKAAGAILGTAQQEAKESHKLLTTKARGEKVPDQPEAYLRAESAITLCGKVIQSADDEIALARQVARKKQQLEAQNQVLAGVAAEVQSNLRTLQAYHAQAAWAQYAQIGERAGTRRVTQYFAELDKVARLSSLAVQEFAEADRLVSLNLERIGGEIDTGRSFAAFATGLERARANCDPAIRRAQSTIDDESADISSYGSYSRGDEDDFHDAEDLLRRAKSRRSERMFADALSLANSAISKAEGTGSRARAAYQRAQEEEEERRRRASDNSFGSDWGGSSGSSGSDWGSSGSDSDWGSSGSDSDWGGSGSDSDW